MTEINSNTSTENPTVRDTFLHVADLHFWKFIYNPLRLLSKRVLGNANVFFRRRHEFPMSQAEALIEGLEETGERQALLTGDFSSTALDEEFVLARAFVDSLATRGFSIHLLPGNHDVYTYESHRLQRFERHFAPYVPDQGYPALERFPGGTPLMLVPTVGPNILSSKGRISAEELRKTGELLKGLASPTVVAGHYPVLSETPGYRLTTNRLLRNADALRRVLGESGIPILYVAGHVHRFSHVQDPVYTNLTHLCTGAFFRHNEREGIRGEFSRVRVSDAGFQVHRYTLREGWESLHFQPESI